MFVPRSVRPLKSRRSEDNVTTSLIRATEKQVKRSLEELKETKKDPISTNSNQNKSEFHFQNVLSDEKQSSSTPFDDCNLKPHLLESSDSITPKLEEKSKFQEVEIPNHKEDETHVKVHSVEQRNCIPGEPPCVICGRYGEYICDVTDHDVCSLECKAVDLERSKRPPEEISLSLKSIFDSEVKNCSGYPNQHSHNDSEALNKETVESDSFFKDELNRTEADEIRKRFLIEAKGEHPPSPILDFEQYNFPQLLLSNLYAAGYESPTPIQMQVIPAVLSNRHILVHSQTGSGKTLSYLIPIILKIQKYQQQYSISSSILSIVLSPTRELSSQIENETKALAKGLALKTGLVVGGIPLPQQLHRLQQNIQLLIGTPGRLIHLLSVKEIPLDQVKIIVLDEVDVMLQMGFRDQVMQIMQALSQPQILSFSATMPASIERFTLSLLKNPIRISLTMTCEAKPNVKHTVLWVENKKKKQKLMDILLSHHFHPPLLIYVESKLGADMLCDFISSSTKLTVKSIHGDKPMSERRTVMEEFMEGKLPVIVSTGLLSRGLNLVSVSQVILFDMPKTIDDYVHCVGRVGRMGQNGFVMTFINEEDKMIFRNFVALIRTMGVVIPKELSNSVYLHSEYALASVSMRKRKF